MVSFKKSKVHILQTRRAVFADQLQYLYVEIIRLHQQLKPSKDKIITK